VRVPAAAPTRVLIVDDHSLFRESLARLLDAEAEFEVVGHCAGVEDALGLLASRGADLVLLDLDLGPERGGDFLARARAAGFPGRVMIVTAGGEGLEAVRLMARGASGIFLKHSPLADLVRIIRGGAAGDGWIDPRYLPRLAPGDAGGSSEPRAGLTGRERDVLRGVFAGLANKEIAAGLGLSESSVKAALQQLFGKTGVRTRGQLVRVALERYPEEL